MPTEALDQRMSLEDLSAAERGYPVVAHPNQNGQFTIERPVRLNLGCGDFQPEGYVNLDKKLGHEVYPLAYPDNYADEIRASHILEHFSHLRTPEVLAEWVRVLKPGGKLLVAVPDLRLMCESYLAGKPGNYQGWLMGGHDDEHDHHGAQFDERGLAKLMADAGLTCIKPWRSKIQDCASFPISLNLEGVKPTERERDAARYHKIWGIMSMPRLAFADNMFCAVEAFTELGLPFQKFTGAFWGQCMERGMEDVIASGAEWILTLDYDTVFSAGTVSRLAMLMDTHPEADAIAPIQVKRQGREILFRAGKQPGDLSYFDGELAKCDTAHFGLTLLRVEALKKMPHPWFCGTPNEKGEWGENRVDEDIYFWRKWKESGNSLYMACHVPIGHMQLMVTWPDDYFRPVHQHVVEYWESGPPSVVRQ